MEEIVKFGCTGCGLCCRFVKQALENPNKAPEPYRTELKKFPYTAKEDGSCEKLINNKCSVYEDRPLICRIDDLYDKYAETHFKVSRKDYHLREAQSCNSMMKQRNYPKNLLVDEKQYRNT